MVSKAKQKLDPNMISASLSGKGLTYIDALEHPSVELSGFPFYRRDKVLCRLPLEIVPEISELGQWVCYHPPGGAIRFRTDSPKVVLRTQFTTDEEGDSQPRKCLYGFDAYVRRGGKRQFVKTLWGLRDELSFEDGVTTQTEELREWTFYFPMRNHFEKLEVGVAKDARILSPRPHKLKHPVLFYGSSVVEGGCASRPGMSYPLQIGRMLDVEVVNWGLGGSGRGELAVARAIGQLQLSAFVYGYDFNSPTPEHLKKTHWPFFKMVRKHHPTIPIIMTSEPKYHGSPTYFGKRAAIIEQTYRKARARGDRNVWFIHGKTMFPKDRWTDCTADTLHPNDWGFQLMAEAVGGELRKVLKLG